MNPRFLDLAEVLEMRNHPFIDGNKRTALASALVFLTYNSIEIKAEFDDLEELTLKTAQGKMNKEQIAVFWKDDFPV